MISIAIVSLFFRPNAHFKLAQSQQSHHPRCTIHGLAKVRKQPDSTWALLQKRLIGLPQPFNDLFEDDARTFIENKAH